MLGQKEKSMIKYILGCSLVALACGGVDDFEPDAVGDAGMGTAVQAFSAKNSPTFQYGARTGSGNVACDKVTTGQVCAIPTKKKIQLAYETDGTGFNNFEQSIINTVMSQDFGQSGMGFTFTGPVDDDDQNIPADSLRMLIAPGACSGGTSSNNIEAYSCATTLSSLTNLSEQTGVTGNYQTFGGCAVNIDRSDIYAKGADSTQDAHLFAQAVGHVIAVCTGIGANTTAAASGKITRRTLNLTANLQGLTAGDVCRAASYNPNSNGQYAITTPQCSSD
jgi:hypothetical protein